VLSTFGVVVTQLELMERRVLGLPLVSPDGASNDTDNGNGNGTNNVDGPAGDATMMATPACSTADGAPMMMPFPTPGGLGSSSSGAASPLPPAPATAVAAITTATATNGGGSRTPPSPSNGLAAAGSARALGTRLSRLEESVAVIDGKLDRLLCVLAAMVGPDGNGGDRAAASRLLLPLSPSSPSLPGHGRVGVGEDGGSDGSLDGSG
jgi:hypothetical protein